MSQMEIGRQKGDGKEGLILDDDAALLLKLLSNDITEDAPVLIIEYFLAPSISSATLLGTIGRAMSESGNAPEKHRGHSVVFKDEDVSKSLILP